VVAYVMFKLGLTLTGLRYGTGTDTEREMVTTIKILPNCSVHSLTARNINMIDRAQGDANTVKSLY
jgi:hypothetical protein